MRLPVICGVIERRILVNYRVDLRVLASILPPPFRPQKAHGFGMAGICLIRLRDVRPPGLPRWLGMASENAAHRVAVEWDEGNHLRTGVYVVRRDTNSRLNVLAGGRIFPGVHHRGEFRVSESENHFDVALESDDRAASLRVVAVACEEWPRDSIFASAAEASSFFEAGSLGYSPTDNPNRYQGLELRCRSWHTTPLAIKSVRSSWFDDRTVFPPGSIELDCGLLMRGIEHEWHGRDVLCFDRAERSDATHRDTHYAGTADTFSCSG
jgi:hypothetical protein